MRQVDLIIRAKNGHDLTARCLESIWAHTPRELYRIILVDDGSEPPYEILKNPDITFRHEESKGAVSATNAGLDEAMHSGVPYIGVMDNDVEVPEGDVLWLQRFIGELEEDHKIGVVGATSDKVNQPQQILTCPQTYTADWVEEERWGSKKNFQVPWFVSFACLMRAEAVRAVGGWDERYNPGNYEDTDYAVQLRLNGWEVRVARSVYLHHHCHSTFGADLAELMKTNQRKFVEKWGLGRLWDLDMVGDKEIAIEAGRRAGILEEAK